MPTPPPRSSRRRSRVALVVLLVLFINLPLAHSSWTRWRIDGSGVDRTVRVVSTDVLSPEDGANYWVSFRYPEEIDPDQEVWPAEVDRATFERAEETGELGVRHLADKPSAYVADGEVRSRLGVVVTVLADVVLALALLLLWRYGGRARRPYLRMVAIADVERCPPGVQLEQVEGLLYVVRGEVSGIQDDEIVLDLGDREVYVVLDGHANPVGYQQPAQVRGRMLE